MQKCAGVNTRVLSALMVIKKALTDVWNLTRKLPGLCGRYFNGLRRETRQQRLRESCMPLKFPHLANTEKVRVRIITMYRGLTVSGAVQRFSAYWRISVTSAPMLLENRRSEKSAAGVSDGKMKVNGLRYPTTMRRLSAKNCLSRPTVLLGVFHSQ